MSKPKLILHIGLRKTGSSALQYFFATNASRLIEAGIAYPHARKNLGDVQITSGNGAKLVTYLRKERRTASFSESAFFEYFEGLISSGDKIMLLSSELLGNPNSDKLLEFAEFIKPRASVRVIAFVRDLYGNAYSSWIQQVKAGVKIPEFEHVLINANKSAFSNIRKWHKHFPTLKLLHYNSEKHDLSGAFFRGAGLDIDALGMKEPSKVNRSLDLEEASILIALHKLHDGKLARQFSDTLIYKRPEKKTELPLFANAEEKLRSAFQADVDWVNKTFFHKSLLKVVDAEAAPCATFPKAVIPEPISLLMEYLIGKLLGSGELDPRILPVKSSSCVPGVLAEQLVARAKGLLLHGNSSGALILLRAAGELDSNNESATQLMRAIKDQDP